jgi:DNA-binding NarL/FixJ family response regulator
MRKSVKTAERQLLQLIVKLSKDNKFLNNKEFISVVKGLKSISNNQQFVENLMQSFNILEETKIYKKGNLTRREKQVLLFIGEGLKNSEIAVELKLSKSTIETHRKHIRKKLKLHRTDNLFELALIFSLQYKTAN